MNNPKISNLRQVGALDIRSHSREMDGLKYATRKISVSWAGNRDQEHETNVTPLHRRLPKSHSMHIAVDG